MSHHSTIWLSWIRPAVVIHLTSPWSPGRRPHPVSKVTPQPQPTTATFPLIPAQPPDRNQPLHDDPATQHSHPRKSIRRGIGQPLAGRHRGPDRGGPEHRMPTRLSRSSRP